MSEPIKASCLIAGESCNPNDCADCNEFPTAWGRFIEFKLYGYNKPLPRIQVVR